MQARTGEVPACPATSAGSLGNWRAPDRPRGELTPNLVHQLTLEPEASHRALSQMKLQVSKRGGNNRSAGPRSTRTEQVSHVTKAARATFRLGHPDPAAWSCLVVQINVLFNLVSIQGPVFFPPSCNAVQEQRHGRLLGSSQMPEPAIYLLEVRDEISSKKRRSRVTRAQVVSAQL